ncbi:Alpha/Beta hydrolase protein [Mycena olivaceomarginata]|nr:Alpha/Beta hydrolase protein [Mycena olivaceomarginata]
MPCIDFETVTGSESFAYTISTPKDASAANIEQGLPTILLLHPVYIASVIFHPIYADSRLRRFNLVAMDLRGHGGTSATAEETYESAVAAQDVLKLMETLKISTCHLVGVSMGASAALQMAILAPEKVLSLFMLSPPPVTEPVEGLEGRQEIANYWVQALQNSDDIDHTLLRDSVFGGLQLTFNNIETPLIKALTAATFKACRHNWSGENLHVIDTVTVKYYRNQPPLCEMALRRIRCPVALVHCSEDLVYPEPCAQELLAVFHDANIEVSFHSLEGAPHLGNVTHCDETNTLLYNFVLDHSPDQDLPPIPSSVQSPFEAELVALGLVDGDYDSDVDSESD